MPDEPETTVNERVARLEQRVDDLSTRVGDMGAVAVAVGVLTERLDTVSRDIKAVNDNLATEIAGRIAHEEAVRKERRDVRIALWTITVMLFCAIIGAAALVIPTIH